MRMVSKFYAFDFIKLTAAVECFSFLISDETKKKKIVQFETKRNENNEQILNSLAVLEKNGGSNQHTMFTYKRLNANDKWYVWKHLSSHVSSNEGKKIEKKITLFNV